MPNNIGLRATRRRGGQVNPKSAMLPSLTYFYVEVTASGSFTQTNVIPATAVLWQVSGGGGGGGGGPASQETSAGASSGGGGGRVSTGLQPGTGTPISVSGTVGAGGSGATARGQDNATEGGTTTIAVTTFSMTATGGQRGRPGDIQPSPSGGGTGSGGVINIAGLSGGPWTNFADSGGGGSGFNRASQGGTVSPAASGAGHHGANGGVMIEWWIAA